MILILTSAKQNDRVQATVEVPVREKEINTKQQSGSKSPKRTSTKSQMISVIINDEW